MKAKKSLLSLLAVAAVVVGLSTATHKADACSGSCHPVTPPPCYTCYPSYTRYRTVSVTRQFPCSTRVATWNVARTVGGGTVNWNVNRNVNWY